MNHTKELSGIERIKRERQRQITNKGYTLEHDLKHQGNELYLAGRCYYDAAHELIERRSINPEVPEDWPFPPENWRPKKDVVRNFEKAGALLLAHSDVALQQGDTEEASKALEAANDIGADIDELCAMDNDFEETERKLLKKAQNIMNVGWILTGVGLLIIAGGVIMLIIALLMLLFM